jgi:hypothetical protein
VDATQERAGWVLGLYPDAGEAGGSFRYSTSNSGGGISSGRPPDPERSAFEAGRRARSKVRRYCASNRLNRLGTLTYAGDGQHDPAGFRSDLAAFFRRLRRLGDGDALPYVWVPEWHKSGHGLHAHFAVGQFIPRTLIERAWGHGFVHIKLLGDLPTGSGALTEARIAAGYLSKYVSKDFGAVKRGRLHRYEVAQGFQPTPVRIVGSTVTAALELASKRMGSSPNTVWESNTQPDWYGPPAVWAQWGR